MQVEREVKATGTWHRSKINKQAQTNDAGDKNKQIKPTQSWTTEYVQQRRKWIVARDTNVKTLAVQVLANGDHTVIVTNRFFTRS